MPLLHSEITNTNSGRKYGTCGYGPRTQRRYVKNILQRSSLEELLRSLGATDIVLSCSIPIAKAGTRSADL